MGDVPIIPEPEPEPTKADEARELVGEVAEKVDRLYRTAVAGDDTARVRRVSLYVLAMVGFSLGWTPVALVALLLLAYTDNVIA